MDQIRITRFITPSIFFLASLLIGLWFDGQISLTKFNNLSSGAAAMIAGATAAALFPIGFVITAAFTIVLRIAFFAFNETYQISLSDEALNRVWAELNLPEELEKTRDNKKFAGITFDHEILHERIHDAVVRLWNAFNISCGSCTALILALLVGRFFLNIEWTCAWKGISAILFLLLSAVAVLTWRETMGLIEFQTHRQKKNERIVNAEPGGSLDADNVCGADAARF